MFDKKKKKKTAKKIVDEEGTPEDNRDVDEADGDFGDAKPRKPVRISKSSMKGIYCWYFIVSVL